MTALDALSAQIDLYQYHKRDAERLRLALAKPMPVGSITHQLAEVEKREGWANHIDTADVAEESLRDAQTVYVADWVVDTLEDAINTFPTDYRPEFVDMPCENGFAFLGRTVRIATRPMWEVEVAAVAWRLIPGRSIVRITTYGWGAPPGEKHVGGMELKTSVLVDFLKTLDEQAVDIGSNDVNDLDESFWVGDRVIKTQASSLEVKRALIETDLRWAMRFVCSLWLFMNEVKVVELADAPVPRQVKRQMERDRIPFEPKVQTILLRRVHYPSARFTEAPQREYNVRWIVRGHWHRFWTGKKDGSEERRLLPRWVSSYVKGPEDAPLSNPIKLFSVTR